MLSLHTGQMIGSGVVVVRTVGALAGIGMFAFECEQWKSAGIATLTETQVKRIGPSLVIGFCGDADFSIC